MKCEWGLWVRVTFIVPIVALAALSQAAEEPADKPETVATETAPEKAAAVAPVTDAAAPAPVPFDYSALSFGLLMALAAAGAGIGIAQIVLLRRARHLPGEFHKDLIHVADTQGIEAALEFCEHRPSSLATVMKAPLLRHGAALYDLETAVRQQAKLVQFELGRPQRILGVFAALAPLSGLLAVCLTLLRRAATDVDASAYVAAALPALTWTVGATLTLVALYLVARLQCADLGHALECIGIEAVLTLDRKARQSIRLIDDLEEHIKTEHQVKIPDLSIEFEDQHAHESAARTAVSTHHTSGRGMAPVEP